MTSVTNNPAVVQVPAAAAKKTRAKRRASTKGIFGLLSDGEARHPGIFPSWVFLAVRPGIRGL
ncbi:MAG: hypothetical protein LUQ31_10260 [Methanoregula sp.]|nr:hypothetical protein [Methanoregula sp.]